MSNKFALIIGNTEYADPGLAQLTAPGKDAEDFARVLKDTEIGAFDIVNVLVNEQASAVIEAIDEFFDQKKPDDLLVLYFSGHGIRDEIGSLYLAFKNTIRSRLRSTAIKSDYIKEAMDQSRSKRQVLVLDCCNSGAFPQGTKAELGGSMGMTKAFQGYGRFVLTASDATQFAWEGDKVIGETDNSLFTHFLVKGLEGEADSDGDGRITVDELYDYTYDQISRVTPKQTPTKSSSKVEGEIVLRQSTRIENIKPVDLPDDLISEIEDTRPAVREWAVQRLEKILKGKNIGLARSAREALEKIIDDENTTRRVAQVAIQILEPIRQQELEEKNRLERLAKGIVRNTSRTASQALDSIHEEERLMREKTMHEAAEQEAKQEVEQLLAEQKVQEERLAREKAEREALELAARRKAKRETQEKVTVGERSTVKPSLLTFAVIGGVIIGLALCGYLAITYFPAILVRPTNTQEPTLTQTIPSSSDDGLLREIKNRGYILISTDPNYEPASFLKATGTRPFDTKCPSDALTTAEMQGFDVDIAIVIGDALGVETCFATPSWDLITAGSWGDNWDVSVGSMTITTYRQQLLDFSIPYYYTPAVVAVRADSGINSLAELNGQVVCVGTATTYESWLNHNLTDFPESSIYAEAPNVTVVSLETDQECAQTIASGRDDFIGYVTSETVVDANISAGFPVVKLGSAVFSEDLAIAFDKSTTSSTDSLRTEINKIITMMRNDGRLSELSIQWFGIDLTQIPNR